MYVLPRGKSGANLAAILPGGDEGVSAKAHQLAVKDVTPAAGTQQSKFVCSYDIADDDITDTNVVVPKTKHGTEGTKDYNSIMKDATVALSTKFGVSKHMIVTAEDSDSLL